MRACVALFFAFAATACLDPIPDNTITPPGTGSVAGTVQDGCTKAAVSGVDVVSGELITQTDGEGRFRLDGLPVGPQVIKLSRKGYKVEESTVQIEEGALATLQASILPELTTIPSAVDLDILFVVDNSGSMEQEQRALSSAFPTFVQELQRTQQLNLHIGVISSDVGAGPYGLPSCEQVGGDGGALQNAPQTAGCTPPQDPWIASITGVTNVPGGASIEDSFACIAQLGTAGCGFEQPLEAMRWALDPTLSTNPGFLRPNATLAVIIVSDEDDCSVKDAALFDPAANDTLGPLTSFRCFEHGVECNERGSAAGTRSGCKPAESNYIQGVDNYVQFLKGLSSNVFFGVIGGPTSPVAVGLDGTNPVLKPSCQTAAGFAVPPIRLAAVVDAFAPSSSLTTICTTDFTQAMRSLASKIVATALSDVCAQ